MKCPICKNKGKQIFSSIILNKYHVNYFQCPVCAAVYTEKPYWLEEAYSDAIVAEDTGIMQRNILNCIITNRFIKYFIGNGSYLDYGGGYGIFVRMMRDIGYDFWWYDKYAENLIARSFEYTNQNFKLVTAFELMEHAESPCIEIEKMLSYSDNILFSTVCYDKKYNYKDSSWWYYVQESGQHIIFYSELTLKYIAQIFNLYYYHVGTLHFYSKEIIPLFKTNVLFHGKINMLLMCLDWLWKLQKSTCNIINDKNNILLK